MTLEILSVRYLHFGPVSLTVRGGECAGISGASGSGKSLLLRALSDLDTGHEAEKIALDGEAQALAPPNEWRRRIGFLPAHPAWWFPTVSEHFRSDCRTQLPELGLPEEAWTWPVSRLSAGEQQRLAFLRLLDREPKALLLDEPTANLDPDSTALFENFVTRIKNEKQIPVIWVSHTPRQLERVADTLYRMQKGTLTRLSGKGEIHADL